MQSVSSRIWTRVAVSISYDDNNWHHEHLHDMMMMVINVTKTLRQKSNIKYK